MATRPDDLPMLALIETPDIPAPTIADQARVVLLDGEAFDSFYTRMKAETDKHVADVTTDKGRKAVIALARRVTTTKTSITAAAKGLTEGWREQTAKVNAARRPIEERLAALADEVRRPVTEWEAAEAARVERNAATISRIRNAATVTLDDTAESVTTRGREIYAEEATGDWLPHELDAFASVKDGTIKALVAARNRLAKEEADRAELEKLRAEATARAEREAAEQAERDRVAAKERAAREAEEAEAARVAEEAAAKQRETDRIAQAERAAEQRARDAAEREAQAARGEERRQHEAALQAERDRVAEVERQRAAEQAEARRVAEERIAAERAAQVERDRIAEEDAKRAANRAHVAKVMGAAKVAIISCGVTEDHAKAIVTAIKAGLVPNVAITF